MSWRVTNHWLPETNFHESLSLSQVFLEKYFWSFGWFCRPGELLLSTWCLSMGSSILSNFEILFKHNGIKRHSWMRKYWLINISIGDFLPSLWQSVELCATQKNTTWVNLTLALKLLKDDQLRNLKSNTTTNRGSDGARYSQVEKRAPYQNIGISVMIN